MARSSGLLYSLSSKKVTHGHRIKALVFANRPCIAAAQGLDRDGGLVCCDWLVLRVNYLGSYLYIFSYFFLKDGVRGKMRRGPAARRPRRW